MHGIMNKQSPCYHLVTFCVELYLDAVLNGKPCRKTQAVEVATVFHFLG